MSLMSSVPFVPLVSFVPKAIRRQGAFIATGGLGFLVQLTALAALMSLAHWSWLPATLVSVELAVVHNFLWHERWTWRERKKTPDPSFASRFARFNVANGLASVAGNIALMWLFVGWIGFLAYLVWTTGLSVRAVQALPVTW